MTKSAPMSKTLKWTPEGQARFDIAETFALSIWPWDALGFELRAIDFLTNLTMQTSARTPRASFWALAQVFGPDWGEACRTLIPGVDVKFSDQEVRAILSVSSVTIDETTIGRHRRLRRSLLALLRPGSRPAREPQDAFRATLIVGR